MLIVVRTDPRCFFAPIWNDPVPGRTPTSSGTARDRNKAWYLRADVPYSLKKRDPAEWQRLKREFMRNLR